MQLNLHKIENFVRFLQFLVELCIELVKWLYDSIVGGIVNLSQSNSDENEEEEKLLNWKLVKFPWYSSFWVHFIFGWISSRLTTKNFNKSDGSLF